MTRLTRLTRGSTKGERVRVERVKRVKRVERVKRAIRAAFCLLLSNPGRVLLPYHRGVLLPGGLESLLDAPGPPFWSQNWFKIDPEVIKNRKKYRFIN